MHAWCKKSSWLGSNQILLNITERLTVITNKLFFVKDRFKKQMVPLSYLKNITKHYWGIICYYYKFYLKRIFLSINSGVQRLFGRKLQMTYEAAGVFLSVQMEQPIILLFFSAGWEECGEKCVLSHASQQGYCRDNTRACMTYYWSILTYYWSIFTYYWNILNYWSILNYYWSNSLLLNRSIILLNKFALLLNIFALLLKYFELLLKQIMGMWWHSTRHTRLIVTACHLEYLWGVTISCSVLCLPRHW